MTESVTRFRIYEYKFERLVDSAAGEDSEETGTLAKAF
jgi:hypothetical protein